MGTRQDRANNGASLKLGLIQKTHDMFDALIHPSARVDAMLCARHRAFIVPRLLGGMAVFALFPVYIALIGAPGPLEVAIFGWLVTPIALAYFLSRTGRYEMACFLSAMFLTGIVATVSLRSGGILSFAVIWLVTVPIEASLSASRRVVAAAALLALGAAICLLVATLAGALPPPVATGQTQAAFMAMGVVSAIIYASGIATGAESLARIHNRLLNAEEDRYRLLAKNMSDVITRHGRNGVVEFISPAAELMTGVPVKQLMGHGLFDRVMVADRPAYLTSLANAANQGQAGSVEFRLRRDRLDARARLRAADFIWVEMRCRPFAAEPRKDGDAGDGADSVEVVAVMRDITERKMQEDALLKARQEAETANVAKGRFLATMSHELRTPLNAIIGFSEILTREEEMMIDAARRQEYAKLINDSGHHLLSVVNGILDMSKMESGNFEVVAEPFDPRECIVNCTDLIALKARERDLDLVIKLPADLPMVIGDRRAFKQILFNLLSNAVKFTEAGGHIAVSATLDHRNINLTVSDTGVGISETDLKRIGDPFFQAGNAYERRHEGTGLGLSIVKGLVGLHGGTFEIASKLGEGTSVTVSLPREFKPDQPERIEVEPAAIIAPASHSKPRIKKSA